MPGLGFLHFGVREPLLRSLQAHQVYVQLPLQNLQQSHMLLLLSLEKKVSSSFLALVLGNLTELCLPGRHKQHMPKLRNEVWMKHKKANDNTPLAQVVLSCLLVSFATTAGNGVVLPIPDKQVTSPMVTRVLIT